MVDDSYLGAKVLAVLARRGIQHKALASMANVSPSQVSRWVNEREVLPLYQARRLADALGMTVEELAAVEDLSEHERAAARGRRSRGIGTPSRADPIEPMPADVQECLTLLAPSLARVPTAQRESAVLKARAVIESFWTREAKAPFQKTRRRATT